MLAVGDDHQEHEHDADVQQQPDALEHLQGAGRRAGEQRPDPEGRPGPRPVGEHAQRRARAAEQEHGPQHVEDHEQDQPRAAGVRAVEAGRPRDPLGRVADPDHREHRQRGEAQHRDRVLQEPQHRPAADQRDVEVGVEQGPVRLEVDRREDHERPEDEQVGDARDRPAQQPALAEHLHQLRPQPFPELIPAVVRLLPRADQPVQPERPAAGHCQPDRGHQQPDDQNHHVISSCVR